MDVFDLYDKNSCDMRGKIGSESRTWTQYFQYKEMLEKEGTQVVLVDMIDHPVEGAVPISNELFFDKTYPEGTYFVLYCHSGGSSGWVQQQLKPQLPEYFFINLEWGILMYELEKGNQG